MTMARRWCITLTVLVTITAICTPVVAQSANGVGVEGESFASAFLYSTRAMPDGTTSLEVIGSLVIWFLIVLNIVSLGLIGQMSWMNTRKTIMPDDVVIRVDAQIRAGEFRTVLKQTKDDPSYFAQIMHAALDEAPHGFNAMMRRLEQTADELTTIRFRRLEFLNVLGQVCPMIGLFGTVYGMILAFQAIVMSGGNANPVLLAGGIGTALTTTFWGLVVAIPALAAYSILRNRVDELTTEAVIAAERHLGAFRSSGSAAAGVKRSSSSSTASGTTDA